MALFSEDNLVDAKDFSIKKCKATIQKTGRLGFSSSAAELMQLEPSSCLLVSDCGDGNLAVVVWPDASDNRGFPLHKATEYFTADLKGFFDKKGIDYTGTDFTYIYDIVMTDERFQDRVVYKLTKRVKKRRVKIESGKVGEEGDVDKEE